ncbi:MAG TPA: glycosyltransferase [bacterium]|nr:glycosyltransferase [bacterium]
MQKQSIFYRYPLLYQQSLKLIHRKNLKKRYQLIASFIKEGEKVLEPGCGTGFLRNFLPSGSFYFGFDLNENFINWAQKKYKDSVFYVGDVLDSKSYFSVDVVVICDVLHHIESSKQKKFLSNCWRSAKKKLILCEPKGKNTLLLGKKFFRYFEQDGINQPDAETLWTEQELKKMIKEGFGVIPPEIPRHIEEIGKDILCVFYKEKKSFEKNTKRVSAVIPVFNEEKTVGKIVETFLKSDLIDEVICVNDGSTDRSLEILESFGDRIKLINLKENKGKGYALAKGTEIAKGEIIVFWDADFPNLSLEHIEILVKPALKRNFKAILGVPVKNRFQFSLPTRIYLTGERVYPRDLLLPHLQEMKKTRFGVEIFLNRLVEKKHTQIIPLKGLIFPYKYEKRSLAQASKEYLLEAVELAKEFSKTRSLLPEDLRIIEGLKEINSLSELKIQIKKIKDEKLKKLLKDYILKYIDRVRRNIKRISI